MVGKNDVIKISDFKYAIQKPKASVCVGSIEYASPEMVAESFYTNKTDIW